MAEPAATQKTPGGPYRVVPAGKVAQQLRHLTKRAAALGIKGQFTATLREIERRLTVDPIVCGDLICTYKAARLQEYHWLHAMLSIRYAVDPVNTVVYVKECKPVLSHPLAAP